MHEVTKGVSPQNAGERRLSANPTGLDAYKPSEIAALVEQLGVAKANLPLQSLLTLAILAGAFIALGAAAYTLVLTGADTAYGPIRILGGLVFSVGLILVVVAGAELFTGNALLIMAVVDGKVTAAKLLQNWTLVYLGNAIGAGLIAFLVWQSGLLGGAMGWTASTIAEVKLLASPTELFFRGILCNVLVCLAIWLSIAARTVAGKILAIIGPITVFVALGLEHSIANMYLFPQAVLAGSDIPIGDFLFGLLVVTAGNVIGGAGGVGLAYHFAYAGSANDPNLSESD